LVEVFKDRALGIPPLTTTLARRMMEQTKIYTALKGVRGRDPVDLAALERLLVRFAQLITEQRWIKELDINPLMASPEKLLALDARVLVYDKDTTEEKLPKLAIRPYPIQYVSEWTAKNNAKVTIRPILPEDEEMMVKFHATLSDRSVYLRYLQPMVLQDRVVHDRLSHICHCDYDREIALVVEGNDANGERSIMAVSRLSKLHGTEDARLSILVNDNFQGMGLGGELIGRMLKIARDEKLKGLNAILTDDNQAMHRIFEKLGFGIEPSGMEGLLLATIKL
jgi:acetyltransferase